MGETLLFRSRSSLLYFVSKKYINFEFNKFQMYASAWYRLDILEYQAFVNKGTTKVVKLQQNGFPCLTRIGKEQAIWKW